jgi:PAS domain S-box-containing protein
MSDEIRVRSERRLDFPPFADVLPRESEPLLRDVDAILLREAHAAIAKRAEEQAALYQFTDKLYRAASLDDIYDAAFDAIAKALRCYRASILLFDESGVMCFVAWRGLSAAYRNAVEGHTPWKPDATDPQPICLEDIDAAELPQSLKDVVRAEGIHALAFIPLAVRGRVVGKFMTYYDAPHTFQPDELSLAVAIARHIGFSVDRVRTQEARDLAEAALRESQARLERELADTRLLAAIVESSDDSIIATDVSGTITDWNQGAERLFGYMAKEAIGKHITMLIPSDHRDEEERIIRRISRGQRIDHYETVRQRKDGSLVDISLTVSPIKDGRGKIVGASKIARDITERKRTDSQIVILGREAEHRAKNILANVQAVVHLSRSDTPEGLKQSIEGRIQALANVHRLFVQSRWAGADLRSLIKEELSPYCERDEKRASIEGPALLLKPDMAQAMAVNVHELTTNAAKYGALSVPEGRVQIGWSCSPDRRVTLRWTETGGPHVKPPEHRGFGTRAIESMIRQQLAGELNFDWRASGLICEIVVTL